MGDKLKYKKGDIIYNVLNKPYGTIVKAEKSQDVEDTTNKYDIELLDGTLVPVLEHNIYSTPYYDEKVK